MRTYSKAAFDEAQELWRVGRFSDEWKPYRHRAAMRGFIYPPDGDALDSWADDEPSQRAVLIRAIRETPTLLERAIDRSSSWGEVYSFVIRHLNEDRDLSEAADRETARLRLEAEPRSHQAVMSLKQILNRIGDS